MKALFTPISIGVGLLAGMLATKLFDALWGFVGDEEAPNPKHRESNYGKLVPPPCWSGARPSAWSAASSTTGYGTRSYEAPEAGRKTSGPSRHGSASMNPMCLRRAASFDCGSQPYAAATSSFRAARC